MKLTSKLLIHLIKEQMGDTVEEYPDSQSTFEKIKTLMFDEETYEQGLSLLSSTDKLHPDHADALERIAIFADLYYTIFDSEDPSYRKKSRELRKEKARQTTELKEKFEELFGIQSKLGNEVKLAFQEIIF